MSFFTTEITKFFNKLKDGDSVRSYSATGNAPAKTHHEEASSAHRSKESVTNAIHHFINISCDEITSAETGSNNSFTSAENSVIETIVIDSGESDSDATEVNGPANGKMLEAPQDSGVKPETSNIKKSGVTVREYCFSVNETVITQSAFESLSSKEWSCPLCGTTFKQVLSLKMHVDFNCPIQKKYEVRCNICGCGVSNPLLLRAHLIRNHGLEDLHQIKFLVDNTILIPIPHSDSSSLEELLLPAKIKSREERNSSRTSTSSINTCHELITAEHISIMPLTNMLDDGDTLSNVSLNDSDTNGYDNSSVQSADENMVVIATESGESDNAVHKIKKFSTISTLPSESNISKHISVFQGSESAGEHPSKSKNLSVSTLVQPIKNNIHNGNSNICARGLTVREYYMGITNNKQLSRKDKSCEACGRTFSESISLVNHIDFHCPVLKTYNVKCILCGKIVSNPQYLKIHCFQKHDATGSKKLKFLVDNSVLIPIKNSEAKNASQAGITVVKNQDEVSNTIKSPTMFSSVPKPSKLTRFTKRDLRKICDSNVCCPVIQNENIKIGPFNNISGASVTMQNNKSENIKLECNVCYKEFISVPALMEHLQIHLLCDNTVDET